MTPADERAEMREEFARQRVIDMLVLHDYFTREHWRQLRASQPTMAQDTGAVLTMAATYIVKKKRPSLAPTIEAMMSRPQESDKDGKAGRAICLAHSILETLTLQWAVAQIAKREARRCRH